MTLAQTTTLRIAAMIGALAAVAAVSLWGLMDLRQNLTAALGEYDQLQRIYTVGLPIASARESLRFDSPQPTRALDQINLALQRAGQLTPDGRTESICQRLCDALAEAANFIHIGTPDSVNHARGRINHSLNVIGQLVNATERSIDRINDNAEQQQKRTLIMVGVLSGAFMVLALLIGIWQYRVVMIPLRRLHRGAQRLAAGQFDQRLPASGKDELAALSRQFNRMADELQSVYSDLEERVRRTSNELVRSERLASVGFLAAGVAHEINNPLAIIATHAELTLDQLKRKRDPAALDETAQALRIICDEAFRCKSITEKLLGLSRRDTAERKPVALRDVAQQIARMIGALPEHRHKQLHIEFDDPCTVSAVEGEMKQVLLNLAINAMQAVDDATGQVRVAGATEADTVRITVEDNGRGMDPQTLANAFEPFYSRPPAAASATPATPGTGLGLSIVHAIVTNHQGRIHAQSPGPNRGSQFTIELPAHT